jgi:hypothetical protein
MEKLFENQQTLALFLLFFVPGFISLKTYDQLVPGETRDFSKCVYDAIAYSALNFGLLFWLFDFILSSPWLPRFWWYCCWATVLVIFPVLWPILAIVARKHRWIAKFIVNPNPRVWDCVFQKRECYWMIVHLTDRRIGGVFADKSFASSSPAPPEIYLEQIWKLDSEGRFISPVESTAGVLISGEQIVALELFRYSG